MKPSLQTINEVEVLEILTKAHHHELCRQVEEGMSCLNAVWQDIEKKPVIEHYSLPVQGEILLRCGTFLSYWGHFKQIKNCHERAQDWLTEAGEIFSRLKNYDKVAETDMEMAMTYWRGGYYRDAHAWLESAESKITNPLSAVSIKLSAVTLLSFYTLGITSNQIEAAGYYQQAYQLIRDRDFKVSLSEDSRVKVHYYLNSALIMFSLEKYSEALERYQQAIKFCREVGNLIYLAVAENNSANTYKKLKMFDEALEHINIALELSEQLKDEGSIGGCLDTKAQIYLEMDLPLKALETTERSIKIYRSGDNHYSLIESLWTHLQAMIKLGRTAEALNNFVELHGLAKFHVGEAAAENFAKDFASLIYVKQQLSFAKEVHKFEENLIERALRKCGGLVTPAAEFLQISHQLLSNMLQTRHKELKERFKVKTRARRGSLALITKGDIKKKSNSEEEPFVFETIAGLRVRKPKSVKINMLFEISNDRLANQGLTKGTIAALDRSNSQKGAYPSVVREKINRQVHAGFITELGGMIALESDTAEPIPFLPNDVEILGQIVGYLRSKEDYYVFEYLHE